MITNTIESNNTDKSVEKDVEKEIERRVIAVVLTDSRNMSEVLSAGITEDMFADYVNRIIFSKMCELHRTNKEWDVITLKDYMGKELVEECGGNENINSMSYEPTDAFLSSWVARLLHNHAKRNIQASCNFMAGDMGSDYIEEAEKHVEELKKLIILAKGKKCKTFKEYLDESTEMVKQMSLDQSSYVVKYCIPGVDRKFIHKKGEKHYFIALPGTGKTSFALSMMNNQIDNGIRHVLFCNETDTPTLINRLKAIHANIPSKSIFGMGNFSESTLYKYAEADRWMGANMGMFRIFGQGTYEHSVDGIDTKLKELEEEGFKADIVTVDYIQNMQAVGLAKKLPRVQQIDDIALGLADLMPRHNVAGLILSQVNRDKERDKGSRKFIMADIKGSSAIEQSADHITAIQFKSESQETRYMAWYHLKIRGSMEINETLEFNTTNGKFLQTQDANAY